MPLRKLKRLFYTQLKKRWIVFFHEMPHDSHNGDDTPKKSKKAKLVSSDHEDSKSQKKTKLVAATKAPEPKKPRFDDDLVECLHDCIRGDIE
mmetsp:Transcript_55116/g.82043  ORF Transcript_55116/g.82043 Transcript_55116/m.82043 type:complete len:92 (+) Transcript_55116:135-410(+)